MYKVKFRGVAVTFGCTFHKRKQPHTVELRKIAVFNQQHQLTLLISMFLMGRQTVKIFIIQSVPFYTYDLDAVQICVCTRKSIGPFNTLYIFRICCSFQIVSFSQCILLFCDALSESEIRTLKITCIYLPIFLHLQIYTFN